MQDWAVVKRGYQELWGTPVEPLYDPRMEARSWGSLVTVGKAFKKFRRKAQGQATVNLEAARRRKE